MIIEFPFIQETFVVPLIKLLSLTCVLLGFVLFVFRMEYQPSFTKTWLPGPLNRQPLDMEPLKWTDEDTKALDEKREGRNGQYTTVTACAAVVIRHRIHC